MFASEDKDILRIQRTHLNFRKILINWDAGQGNGVRDFNLSNAI